MFENMMGQNKWLLKEAESCYTSGHYQNALLQREDKYQRYLNIQEERLDLYIYENIDKDYNEKIHKLDVYTSKLETEDEIQNTTQLSSVFCARGKPSSLGEGKQEDF